MEQYRFFDSTIDDPRDYNADDFAEYFRLVLTSGILNGGTNLKVECPQNNMQTYIQEGYAWLLGYMYKVSDEPLYLTHDVADPTLDRIDRVVIRLDKTLNNRYVKAFVLKGTPSLSPVPPSLTRDEDIYEISLAQVRITAGKSFIDNTQITDERLDNNVCGLINSLIQADTTEIFNQFQAWYNTKTTQFQNDWDAWFTDQQSGGYVLQSEFSNQIGVLNNLPTQDKSSIVNSIVEINSKITDKQTIYNLEREIANLKAESSVKNRVDGASSVFFDLMDGLNAGSSAKIDLTSTTSTTALNIGDTVLTNKVVSIAGFQVGQEITIYDDVNLERPTVTRAESLITTQTIDRSTPVTVVGSAYDTSGNGGRKVVRLSNGWIVAAVLSGEYVKLYHSKDNGTTWTLVANTAVWGSNGFAIASLGTKVYVLGTTTQVTNVSPKFELYDITNAQAATTISIDPGQNSLDKCSLAINSTGTELHAAWASKNATYPNSFNLRYCKGTIDGSGNVTWGSVTQVTVESGVSGDWVDPCIVVRNNQPYIFASVDSSKRYLICLTTAFTTKDFRSGTINASWGSKIVYDGGGASYIQSNPCAIVKKSGSNIDRIWVAWHGLDSTDTTKQNLRVSYSDDGGATWSAPTKITSGNTVDRKNVTLSENNSGDVYAIYDDNGTITHQKCTNGTTTFGTTTAMDAGTNPSAINYLDFSSPTIVFMSASTVKFRGVFNASVTTNHLEITPLTKAYKSGAKIARTTVIYDTVNKCLKFGGWDTSTTYSVTSPTTVVASAYDTSGNGGRKLVRLSSGTIVAAVYDSSALTYRLYKSTDNGMSFTPLTTFLTNALGTGTIAGCALVAYSSTQVGFAYVFSAGAAGDQKIRFTRVNVSDGTNTGIVDVDFGQVSVSSPTINIDSNGKLWIGTSTKNSTYPNSFNIRVSSSTDGGQTWAAPTQVTNKNTSGYDITNPCIIIKNNGSPVIVAQYNANLSYSILAFPWNGASFPNQDTCPVVYLGNSYSQSNPCAVVDSNDVIHVVWHGKDATDSSVDNIRYSKSTDGGSTWSAMTKLTNGNVDIQENASITVNKTNNKIYIVWSGRYNSYYQIQHKNYDGNAWSSTTIQTSVNSHKRTPSTLADSTDFTTPLTIYKDEASAVKFFGTWTAPVTQKLTWSDIRYNITPIVNSDEVVAWIQRTNESGFTVNGYLSVTDPASNENMQAMSKSTATIDATYKEDQFIKSVSTPNSRIAMRLTLNRPDTVVEPTITKITGAIN